LLLVVAGTMARALGMRWWCAFGFALLVAIGHAPALGAEQSLPDPLGLDDVMRIARSERAEVRAARLRARAAAERTGAVSALPDPMLMTSIDHLPFSGHGADVSAGLEQSFPMSRVLGARERAAEAEARHYLALSRVKVLDVELDAATSFFMLYRMRRLTGVLEEQRELARALRDAANARLGAGVGPMADVLRADSEIARLGAAIEVNRAERRGAAAMLNVALNRSAASAIPRLAFRPHTKAAPRTAALVPLARARRPEVAAARAEMARARAEIEVMEQMYGPMAVVRVGPAYTMAEGMGLMAMVGISLPFYIEPRQAGLREGRAMASAARAELNAMTRMVEGEVAASREQVEAQRVLLATIRKELLPRARATVDASLASYSAGELPLVSLIDASRELQSVRLDEIGAEVSLGLASARLRRALGRPGRGRP
jgi:outer membrane protein TolC